MPLPPLDGVANVLAGLAMAALAAWLWSLDATSRLHRAFAVFLVLRGGMNVLEGYSYGATETLVWMSVHPYFDLAVLASTIWLAVVFRARHGGHAAPRWGPPALAAVVFFVGLAYAVDAALYYGPGPLVLVAPLRLVAYPAVAALLLADALRTDVPSRRASGLLAALGFTVSSAAIGTLSIVARPGLDVAFRDLGFGFTVSGGYGAATNALEAIVVVLTLGIAAVAARAAVRSPDPSVRSDCRRFLTGLALAAVAGLAAAAAWWVGGASAAAPAVRTLDGLTTLALPLLVAYAILRHRLFGIDVKVKRTLRQSTVAAVFLAVFFGVSELAQELFSDAVGPYLGIGAAALLVFAIAPLQRFAERVSDAAMPGVRPVAAIPQEERLAIYREQARAAWLDGAVDRSERALLDRLRATLGLSAEDAARAESEAASAGDAT